MQNNTELDLSVFKHFHYDPFSSLDAANDLHLPEYFVLPNTAGIALRSVPSIILSQPGGGKSALRLYVEQEQQGLAGFTFTLTYLIQVDKSLKGESNHQKALLTALAHEILIRITDYPSRFLSLDYNQQQALAAILDVYLDVNLEFAIQSALFKSAPPVETIAGLAGRTYLTKNIANNKDTLKTCYKELLAARDAVCHTLKFSFTIDEALDLVKDVFSAKEIYILVDGIDNSTESKQDPRNAAEWIMPLFMSAQQWEAKNIYLKSFFTAEMEAPLKQTCNRAGIEIPTRTLEWSDFYLTEVIRARVAAATKNRFNSLYAISSLDLREIEYELVQRLPSEHRLPRELILITRYTLANAIKRHPTGGPAIICRKDIEEAFQMYTRLPNRAHKKFDL